MTIEIFKAFFDRGEFAYGETLPSVRDADITRAINDATARYNHDLYPDEDTAQEALKWLTAHELQLRLELSKNGAQPKFNQASRGADGLSESVIVPEWMQKGTFAYYSTTYYGQKFLTISAQYLTGAVFSVEGATNP